MKDTSNRRVYQTTEVIRSTRVQGVLVLLLRVETTRVRTVTVIERHTETRSGMTPGGVDVVLQSPDAVDRKVPKRVETTGFQHSDTIRVGGKRKGPRPVDDNEGKETPVSG